MKHLVILVMIFTTLSSAASGQNATDAASAVAPLLVLNAVVAESANEEIRPTRIQARMPVVIQEVEQKYVVAVATKWSRHTSLETRSRMVPITQEQSYEFDVTRVKFRDINGNDVDLADALKSIQKHGAFLLPQADAPVAPAVLKLFNTELVQIVQTPIPKQVDNPAR